MVIETLNWCRWCWTTLATSKRPQTNKNFGLTGGYVTAWLPICDNCNDK